MFFGRDIRHRDNAVTATVNAMVVHVAEYQGLRQEVNNRLAISNALVAADLTALGLGLSQGRDNPQIFIGLAVVSSLLWIFWCIHALQIYRIAAYVAMELGPRLAELCKCSLLGWEAYVRNLTYSQQTAVRTLCGDRVVEKTSRILLSRDGIYVSFLLGGAPPLLLVVSASISFDHNPKLLFWIEIAASLLLWLFALLKASSTLRTTNFISERILESRDQH